MAEIQTAPTMDASNVNNNNSTKNPFEDSFDSTLQQQQQNPQVNETPYKPILFPEDHLLQSPTDRELRAKRLKEEGVRRLVSDINRTATVINPMASTVAGTGGTTTTNTNASSASFQTNSNLQSTTTTITTGAGGQSSSSNLTTFEQQSRQQDELLVASTIATAIERNLDRELHTELTKQMKESASSISKICHEHSDDFLHSVGKVVSLGQSCGNIRLHIDEANEALQLQTGEPMLKAASQLEYTKSTLARAKTVHGVVSACKDVAMLLERARKQADLARPRSALDAVDEARSRLTAPLSMIVGVGLYQGMDVNDMKAYFDALIRENEVMASNSSSSLSSSNEKKNNLKHKGDGKKVNEKKNDKGKGNHENNNGIGGGSGGGTNNDAPSSLPGREEKNELRLDDTPFGSRAMAMLPKIENEVLMGARRGLNKWFLSIRSGGDGAKAGRAALRKCARSMAIGPGQLGLGGNLQGYTWRAKNADNLIARVSQNSRVARAARMGYWFERDHGKELARLEKVAKLGMERRAEAFSSAFGWYRCWEEDDPLEVEELHTDGPSGDPLSRSGHALNRSGHSLNRSGHGLQTSSSRHGRSLGYRSSQRRDDSLTRQSGAGGGKGKKTISQWSMALTPSVLFDNTPNKVEDETKLVQIPNSVYPVRRAEAAFALLGKSEEFAQYYEQNRFGVMKIGEKTDEDGFGKETRSSLSSLTGDDVSQGTDRIFFSRSLPHFCTSVVGFSTIEAALELGNFQHDENGDSPKMRDDIGRVDDEPIAMSFRESSARYERKLISELGSLLRSRAIRATLVELSRASCLMAAFRSALKIVHPSSATRNIDKELIAMDVDILMTGLKVAQEEQRRATSRIIFDDNKEPMTVPIEKSEYRYVTKEENSTNIPDEEVKGYPFGLAEQKEKPGSDKSLDELEGDQTRRSGMYNRKFDEKEKFKFSSSVPLIVRSIHSRAIAFAAFASSQEELGQVFVSKKGGGISGYVLDCVEQLIVLAAVGLKENNDQAISTVQEAVQVMSNINSLKTTLPRLFGVIMRGLFHLGMAKGDQLEESFEYAESILVKADEYCDNQTKSMFNVLFNICQNKIDELLRFSLENFQWVTRSTRDSPNTYCESLIDYLRNIFKILK